ncbi:MAG: hypothetical protein QOF62_2135 [Pyrinomonadaceae bacterium]|jgi:hypothetical protein|nr:hypothetical protein [Pyrinomonadaceae bacterium]
MYRNVCGPALKQLRGAALPRPVRKGSAFPAHLSIDEAMPPSEA